MYHQSVVGQVLMMYCLLHHNALTHEVATSKGKTGGGGECVRKRRWVYEGSMDEGMYMPCKFMNSKLVCSTCHTLGKGNAVMHIYVYL